MLEHILRPQPQPAPSCKFLWGGSDDAWGCFQIFLALRSSQSSQYNFSKIESSSAWLLMSTVWMLHVYVQKFKVPSSETDKVYRIHGRNGHNNESGMYLSMVTFSCKVVRVHEMVFFLTGWISAQTMKRLTPASRQIFQKEKQDSVTDAFMHQVQECLYPAWVRSR